MAWALVAAGGPATLRVSVADPSGAAIQGAQVRVDAGSASFKTATDARGRAALLHLPEGAATLHVEARQFIARNQAIELRPGENRIAWQLRMAPHQDAITVTDGEQGPANRRP